MQNVFNNDMVAHVWAQQTQPFGRNSTGSFYFDGSVIYSYGGHFPIAKILNHQHTDENICLFTTASYSVTTSQHISKTWQALPSYYRRFDVKNVDVVRPGFDLKTNKHQHKENRADMIERVEAALVSAKRARAEHIIRGHMGTAQGLARDINDYNRIFKLGYRKEYVLPSMEEIQKKVEIAKRAQKKANKLRAERVEKQRLETIERNRIKLIEWRNGMQGIHFNYDVPIALRLSSDGELIETSARAEIPTKHAALIWRKVCECVKNKTSYKRNGHTIHAGHFTIDSISIDGTLKAGCHTIYYDELLHCATDLLKLEV